VKRYLILAEGHSADPHYGKTARGVMRYGLDPVVAIVDSERAGETVDGIPVVADVEEGLTHGPTTALVGVAPSGGRLPEEWRGLLRAALAARLDVEAGMHQFLADDTELAGIADRQGVQLRDLRRPPTDLSVTTGANLTHCSSVVLTVGSDSAIGKMSVALELDREARARGIRSVFVPTGQTGIAIAGWGIAVDAVVADFIAGAAERLIVEGATRGDLLWVEGQGSLIHPDYSGVTLGLYHGSAPHWLVLCHQVGDEHIEEHPDHPIPPLVELVDLHERMALPARPAKVVAIALNTRRLGTDDAFDAIAAVREETGLPADDPVRFGPGPLFQAVVERLPSGMSTTDRKA
jgi:uncharacterized NAD-dependent epimerase/dehydratase family protein